MCFYLDNEIPRIRCPKNVVVESNTPTRVYWGNVISMDNVNTKSITFNPPNGTIFHSNKYHKVVATVTDTNGNKDSCVIEVYVKGKNTLFFLVDSVCCFE